MAEALENRNDIITVRINGNNHNIGLGQYSINDMILNNQLIRHNIYDNTIEICENKEIPINLIILGNINTVKFSDDFNSLIDNLRNNKNIKTIIFNSKFNQKIDNLPINLSELYLGYDFNQELRNLPGNEFY